MKLSFLRFKRPLIVGHYEVNEIKVIVNAKNKISYDFSNVRRNVSMPESLFIVPSNP
jgi:outer membrane lipoprotein-sorting protein